MNKIVLFEDEGFANLLPLVYWRSVFELRLGRRILLDRCAQSLGLPVSGIWTRDWIAKVSQHRCSAPANVGVDGATVLVNGRWVFDQAVDWPPAPHVGVVDDQVAYIVCDAALANQLAPGDLLDPTRRKDMLDGLARKPVPGRMIRYPWDIVGSTAEALESDWREADGGVEVELDARVVLENAERIHIGQRCRIHPTAAISAVDGPVFIGEGATVGAHTLIEGPAYVAPRSQVNPHAWLHGANSIGPVCKVGGEIDSCVIQGYSNKQHDGFLGHTYVGSWVNLGAGTVNSDLKNTYGPVRVPVGGTDVDSAQMFFGAVIGDFVKTGINTTMPTGAVIGLGATLATAGMVPKFVPSFGWLTDAGLADGDAPRLLDVATKVMARRNVDMVDAEVELFLDLPTRARVFELRDDA